MGQYYKGRKIGTCESMYYMRMSEAEKLAKMGACDDDGIKFSDMLKDGVTRFRFPFPKEDGKDLLGSDVMWSQGFVLPAGGVAIEHGNVCISSQPAQDTKDNTGRENINIFVPCPYSQAFKDLGLKSSRIGEQFIEVKFEGMRFANETRTGALERKTIFECLRCGNLQRLPAEEVAKLKARALEYFEHYNEEGKNEGYKGDQERYDEAVKIINNLY